MGKVDMVKVMPCLDGDEQCTYCEGTGGRHMNVRPIPISQMRELCEKPGEDQRSVRLMVYELEKSGLYERYVKTQKKLRTLNQRMDMLRTLRPYEEHGHTYGYILC